MRFIKWMNLCKISKTHIYMYRVFISYFLIKLSPAIVWKDLSLEVFFSVHNLIFLQMRTHIKKRNGAISFNR